MDRRLFSKIRSSKDYQPSKSTVFALIIALKTNYTTAEILLEKAGFGFSKNKLTDIIVMFCIENRIYDISSVDELLVHYKEKPLGCY